MDTVRVINNHVGFRPGNRKKKVLVPYTDAACDFVGGAFFHVLEHNNFSKYPLNSPEQLQYSYRQKLEKKHTDFGMWWVGDFSHISEPGVYQVYNGSTPGVSFVIRDDVWVRIIPECIRYFQIQSCGREVPGWHDACHLDDGYIREQDKYINAAGGWHDAGDFRKWASSTAMNAISLLIGNRIWKGREKTLGLSPGILLDESLEGMRFFLGIQDPDTGALYHNIAGGRNCRHDNLENRYTDNIPRSGDERRIFPDVSSGEPPSEYTTLFALYANELKEENPEHSQQCIEAAQKSLAFDLKNGRTDAEGLQWRCWGFLELWRYTKDENYLNQGISTLKMTLDLQVRKYIGEQTITRGFFRMGENTDSFYRKHIGTDHLIWIIAEYIKALPKHEDVNHWKDALSLWVDDYFLVFANRNPFCILPYSFYSSPPDEHPHCVYRKIDNRLYFRYFLADNRFGSNARSCVTAAALANTAKVLNRKTLLDYGYKLLEWVVGNNPFQISTMNGVGVRQPCALSYQMGNIPGGMTMGVFGDDNDQPAYYPHEWCCQDEYYGYQTSQFFWALLALQDVDY